MRNVSLIFVHVSKMIERDGGNGEFLDGFIHDFPLTET